MHLLRERSVCYFPRVMSTLAEIERALETLPPEQWEEIRHWMDNHARKVSPTRPAGALPDFLARQQARFGDRILQDSQAALDDLRVDRF
jgi:hypothetical protein